MTSSFFFDDGYSAYSFLRGTPRGAYNGQMAVVGNFLLAIQANVTFNDSWGALDVIDISDPALLKLTGRYAGFVQTLAIAPNSVWLTELFLDVNPTAHGYQFLGSRLQQVHIETPANPQRISDLPPVNSSSGDANSSATLDLAPPSRERPIYETTATNSYDALNVAVAGNYLLVANAITRDGPSNISPPRPFLGGGLNIIDISDPAAPLHIAEWHDRMHVYDVEVSNDHAYLLIDDDDKSPMLGLQIVDISEPSNQSVGGRSVSNPGVRSSGFGELCLLDQRRTDHHRCQ